jgi:hypothetical protein
MSSLNLLGSGKSSSVTNVAPTFSLSNRISFLEYYTRTSIEIYDIQMTYKNKPTFVACGRYVVTQKTHTVIIMQKYSQQDEAT